MDQHVELICKHVRGRQATEIALFRWHVLREPIQYVLGYTEFDGLSLKQDRRAFPTCPETIQLVHVAAAMMAGQSQQQYVVDVGTGSGAIALALARRFPDAQFVGIDLMSESLDLAHENGHLNSCHNVSWMVGDLIAALPDGYEPTLIVADLPYGSPTQQLKSIDNDRYAHAPRASRFVDSPCGAYKNLLTQARNKGFTCSVILETGVLSRSDVFRELGDTGIRLEYMPLEDYSVTIAQLGAA